ncbi:MAG: amidohydrolase family protein [Propionibacteriaceae bacterium]|jgi:predicted amidohydrolase YtcJ|nr:amidohydrolase family protein [Propionibacteriaceae bacterium]
MESTIYVGGAIFREGIGSVPGWGIRVEGDRIKAVLPDQVLREQADSGTRVVELAGGFVSPAFTDAHLHPAVGGLDAARCDLSGGADSGTYLKLIADYADAHSIKSFGSWIATTSRRTSTRWATGRSPSPSTRSRVRCVRTDIGATGTIWPICR